jgi:predicted ATPase
MISEIQFPHLKKSKEFDYATEVAFFKKNKGVAFQPGLNILFGPNGCGKSTILRMAALSMAAEQGGVSTVTQDWINKVIYFKSRMGEKFVSSLEGINVIHDGQPLLYGNPRNMVGLYGGGAAFDDDFFREGVANLTSKASTGHTTMNRMHRLIAVSQNDAPFPAKVDHRVSKLGLNDLWQKKLEAALQLLKASIPKGPPTLIFDEPESGLAIPAQGNLFNLLFTAARKNNYQIIVATHSTFCLGLPDVNYIEMEPGYLQHAEECITSVHKRFDKRRLMAGLEKNLPETTKKKPSSAKTKKAST